MDVVVKVVYGEGIRLSEKQAHIPNTWSYIVSLVLGLIAAWVTWNMLVGVIQDYTFNSIFTFCVFAMVLSISTLVCGIWFYNVSEWYVISTTLHKIKRCEISIEKTNSDSDQKAICNAVLEIEHEIHAYYEAQLKEQTRLQAIADKCK